MSEKSEGPSVEEQSRENRDETEAAESPAARPVESRVRTAGSDGSGNEQLAYTRGARARTMPGSSCSPPPRASGPASVWDMVPIYAENACSRAREHRTVLRICILVLVFSTV